MTPRELLGDDVIAQLQKQGFSNDHIRTMAKSAWDVQKQELAAQNEQRLNDAGKMDSPLIRFGAGIAKSALETGNGILKLMDNASDYVDTSRVDEAIASTGGTTPPSSSPNTTPKEEPTKNRLSETITPWVKRLDEYQKNYKSTIGDKWDIASTTGELVGGFADPVNFIPIGSANMARRVIGLAVTGAMSGGVSAYGGDRNVAEGAALGAIAAPVIGEALHYSGVGLAKLWNKTKDEHIKAAQNSEDLNTITQNGLFDIPLMKRADGKEELSGTLKPEQTDINVYADHLLKDTPKEIKDDAVKAVQEGKVPENIAPDKAKDLEDFNAILKTIDQVQNSEPYLNAVDQEVEALNSKVGKSTQDSIIRFNNMSKETIKEINANPQITTQEMTTLMNAKFHPSEEETLITHFVNDGAPVENRLAGWNVIYALDKSIKNPIKTPESFNTSLKEAGYGEEQATVLTQAYVNQDIKIAQNYFNEKISQQGAEYATKRAEVSAQHLSDERMARGKTDVPGENGNVGNDTPGGSGDAKQNQQHQEQRIDDDKRTIPNDGQDVTALSENGGVSSVDEKVGGLDAVRSNGDSLPGSGSDAMVQPKNSDNHGATDTTVTESGDVSKEKLNETGKSDAQTNPKTESDSGIDNGQRGEMAHAPKETTLKNLDLRDKEPIILTKGERKQLNNEVDTILKKKPEEISDADKETLRRYTGEGGIEKGTYGSLSEHYTPYETVRGIYDALDRAGVPMKKALEPAVGSGNFVGHRPGMEWTTIDIDPKATAINKILYPEAKHYNTSFEEFKGDGFDLIVSNVPFIETRGAGAIKNRPDVKALHDYYFVSAVDKVKDDGVVAFVTTRGTMDKVDAKIRKELMSKADVIGAYRLPEGTFSKNAHTDVGADVVFLKKRKEGVETSPKQKADNEAFMRSTKTEDGIYLNDYYKEHPENILGDMEVGVNKQFGGKAYSVKGQADYSKMKINYDATETTVKEASTTEKAPRDSQDFWDYVDENGLEAHGLYERGIIIKDGEVKVARERVEFDDIDGGASVYEDISHTPNASKILKLEDIVNAGEAHNLALGQKLISEYRKEFGVHPYKDASLKKVFSDAGERDKLFELGSYFDKDFKLAQIFSRETKFEGSGKVVVTKDSPINERMMYHENNKGVVDLSSKGGEFIREGDLHQAIENGYSLSGIREVQNDILYFSGNLYDKIDQAKKLLDFYKDDAALSQKLEKQLVSLEGALPPRRFLDTISIRGDEPWLLENGLEIYPLQKVERIINKGEQRIIEYKSGFGDVFDNYLNAKALIARKENEPFVSYRRRLREANDEVQSILGRIKESVLANESLAKRIEETYNRKFNGYVSPDYKKASYLIKDVVEEAKRNGVTLRDNQVQWITRAVYEGKGINAHDVGGGKTLAAIVLARALKVRGVANKPLFPVPAKVLGNWEKEIKKAFPDAKVVNLFNLEKSTRAKKLYELGNNEADYVLISHEGFKELKLPLDVELRYTDELLSENLRTSFLGGRALALQEQKINKYKAVIRKENADKRITIDKLGIDAIFSDEGRKFKNIGVHNKLTAFKLGKPFSLNVSEKGDVTLDSAIAYDFRFKTRYIAEKNNGKNVFIFDATPTPNKPMEIYTMLKHLDNKIFDEYGIYSDRDFANRYFEYGAKITKSGQIEQGLVYIKNAHELRGIMDRYVNRISMQEFKEKGIIDLPDEKIQTHYLDASDESDFVFNDIRERLLKAKSNADERHKVMGIFSEGVGASTDPRTYQRGGVREFINPTDDNNKIEAVVSETLKQRSISKRYGQIIFLDNAGHVQMLGRDLDKSGFVYEPTLEKNLHQEIKDKLIASKAYRPDEIAIISGKEITDPKTGKEISGVSGKRAAELKQSVVDAYDSGQIKVVIGTTQSAGEGMNIQKFTTDIYHIDIPWTPAEIIQRNGRGVRYGNENGAVNTHYYFQAGTFDELMYRTVTNKRSWNEALWDADVKDRIEITDESSAMPKEEEFMLQMEKDPLKRRKLELQIEYGRLEDEFSAVNEEGYFLKGRKEALIRSNAAIDKEIAELRVRGLSDRPNKYLGDILDRIAKSKDAKQKAELRADYDAKILNAKANIDRLIEAKARRIKEQEVLIAKTDEDIKINKQDLTEAKSRLDTFEERHLDGEGNIKTEIEEGAC